MVVHMPRFSDVLLCLDISSNISKLCDLPALRRLMRTGASAVLCVRPCYLEMRILDLDHNDNFFNCWAFFDDCWWTLGTVDLNTISVLYKYIACSGGRAKRFVEEAFHAIVVGSCDLVFHAVLAKLIHDVADVRRISAKRLGFLATQGNAFALTSLAERLEDDDAHVRLASARSICTISGNCDPLAMATIVQSLRDESPSIRKLAVFTLSEVSGKRNVDAIIALRACFKDGDEGVRATAIEGIVGIAEKGDMHVVDTFIGCLADESARVRKVCLDLLCGKTCRDLLCNEHGNCNPAVVGALLPLLDDARLEEFETYDEEIRSRAAWVISRLSKKGDQKTIFAICARLSQTLDPEVRESFLDSLVAITDEGNRHVLDTLCACLAEAESAMEHEHEVNSFIRILGIIEERSFDMVASHVVCEEHMVCGILKVRGAVCMLLRRLAKRASADILDDVIAAARIRLSSGDDHIKAVALCTLGAVARNADRLTLQLLAPCLNDSNVALRQLAAKVVSGIAEVGDQFALTILTDRIDDFDDNVRRAVAAAIKIIHIPVAT